MKKAKGSPTPFNIGLGDGSLLLVGYTKDCVTMETTAETRVAFSPETAKNIAKALKKLAEAVEDNEKA